MTQHQISLIKKSWALVAQMDKENVGTLFYNHLFEIVPEVKPMFSRTTLPEQSKKLLNMLSYVINKLDKLEDIIIEVQKLAQLHVHYGVKVEHYTAVGTALLWTLQKGLGSNWTPELSVAWIDCYTLLSGSMIISSNTVIAAA